MNYFRILYKFSVGIFFVGQAFAASASLSPQTVAMDEKMETVFNESAARYFSSATNLFYTRPLADIPSPQDMKALKPPLKSGEPNYHGAGSGTEDCSMLCGIMLAGLCDQYACIPSAKTAARARTLFNGLALAATVHGERGFVARGVSPVDCKTVYPGTSRDQYTHSVHGMWRYFHSPIATPQEKARIAAILGAVADKMAREVVADAEPPFSYKYLGGIPDSNGVAKMRDVRPHEAARLAMLYAAAYDTGKNPRHKELWRGLMEEALAGSEAFTKCRLMFLYRWVPAYSVLQMETSLELLYLVEPSPETKARIGTIMNKAAEFVEKSKAFPLKKLGIRDSSEVINGQLLSPDYRLPPDRVEVLRQSVAKTSAKRYGAEYYTLSAAYWRARLEGYFN